MYCLRRGPPTVQPIRNREIIKIKPVRSDQNGGILKERTQSIGRVSIVLFRLKLKIEQSVALNSILDGNDFLPFYQLVTAKA